LSNSGDYTDRLVTELVAYGPPPPRPDVHVDSAVLASLHGEYRPAFGPSVYVRLEDEGYLTLQSLQRARMRMYAESDTSFFLMQGGGRVTFSRDQAGGIAGLVLLMAGTEQVAEKVSDDCPPPRAVVEGLIWSSVSVGWGDGARALIAVMGAMALFVLIRWAVLVRRAQS
jgi:hypothetical protein